MRQAAFCLYLTTCRYKSVRTIDERSKLLAKEAIDSFTQPIRQYNGLTPRVPATRKNLILQAPKPSIQTNPLFNELLAKSKDFGQKGNIEQKVATKGKSFFEKSKEWFNNTKQSLSLNNKPKEPLSTAPKGKLASEVYQEMIYSLKNKASYPEKAGIDIFNNSEHLDLMLAMQLAKKDAVYEKVLKQSPNYRSKEPAEAREWFDNMLKDGISLSKEYYLDSTGSQKIIRSYDNDASRPLEKSNFEKLSESAQKYNSEYTRNREGLLIAVTTAAIRAGMNPEQVLRESPDYLLAISGKGEALVEKTIEKAQSAIQSERSRVEQQAQRDSQHGRDSGCER